jgi:hypothetical protein
MRRGVCEEAWADGRMGGWADGWMGRWADGRIDGYGYRYVIAAWFTYTGHRPHANHITEQHHINTNIINNNTINITQRCVRRGRIAVSLSVF